MAEQRRIVVKVDELLGLRDQLETQLPITQNEKGAGSSNLSCTVPFLILRAEGPVYRWWTAAATPAPLHQPQNRNGRPRFWPGLS
jgi:hypothetical protein